MFRISIIFDYIKSKYLLDRHLLPYLYPHVPGPLSPRQSKPYFFVTKYIFFSLQCERFEKEGCKVDNTERCERLEKLCGCVANVS